MPNDEVTAPILSYEDLRRKADEFLAEHHPAATIPVPIEEIVDLKLGLNVIPAQGLHRLLDTDGFLTGDLSDLWVDENVWSNYPGRYRFTLAHEVGHFLLHRRIYERHSFSSIEGWKTFVNAMPEDQHQWLEYQAYSFGGLVLVPHASLLEESRKCIAKVKQSGVDLATNADFAWTRIAAFLAKSFAVSRAVVEKRLAKDEIPQLFK